MRVIKWWGTQSRYMKMLHIGSIVAIFLSVSILLAVGFIIRPLSLGNPQIFWAVVVVTPIATMGWIAYKLGRKEAELKGAKEGSNDGKDNQ